MNRLIRSIAVGGILWTLGGAASCGSSSTETPPTGGVCTAIGCDSGALYYGSIPLNGVDPTTLEVRACMNATCDTQPLRPATGAPGIYICAGSVFAVCQLQVDRTSAFLTLQTLIPEGMDPSIYLKDGDTYQVTFGVPAQKPLVTLAATAGYLETRPNGPNCGSICKQITLTAAP